MHRWQESEGKNRFLDNLWATFSAIQSQGPTRGTPATPPSPSHPTNQPLRSNQTARNDSPGRFVETILELADRTQNFLERRHQPTSPKTSRPASLRNPVPTRPDDPHAAKSRACRVEANPAPPFSCGRKSPDGARRFRKVRERPPLSRPRLHRAGTTGRNNGGPCGDWVSA